MCEGIVAELETVDLGDKRRNDRSRQLLELLAADPAASVNASCPDWSETQGAYRLLKNEHVRPEDILSAHSEKTMERIEQEPVVLVIQDTTTLNYTKHPPRDALLLDSDDQFGLYDHTHLTCTPEGLALGVVGVEFFGRTPETLGKTSERKADPIETKESYRWLKGYQLANDIQQPFPDKTIVSIGDREGDLYDIYLAAAETPNSADYVFRLKSPRSTLEQDPTAGKHAYQKVRKCVEESTVIATQTVTLPRTPKRKERTATLEIRAITLTVKPPHARSYMGPVQMNFVSVIEIGRPADDLTAVNWFLGTSLPIDSLDDVLNVVKYYRKRWTIEVYTRVYKTGCRVLAIQLSTNSRLKRCLMFYKIIAWRIMYLTFMGRECPEIPCDHMFAPEEWKSVWCVTTEEPLPEEPPTLKEFIRLLAKLGGYNDRTCDMDPGPQALWVGMRRMADFTIAWLSFGPPLGVYKPPKKRAKASCV